MSTQTTIVTLTLTLDQLFLDYCKSGRWQDTNELWNVHSIETLLDPVKGIVRIDATVDAPTHSHDQQTQL